MTDAATGTTAEGSLAQMHAQCFNLSKKKKKSLDWLEYSLEFSFFPKTRFIADNNFNSL